MKFVFTRTISYFKTFVLRVVLIKGGSRIFSRAGGGGWIDKNYFGNFVDLFLGRPNWFSELFQSTKNDPVLAKLSVPQANIWKKKQAKKESF